MAFLVFLTVMYAPTTYAVVRHDLHWWTIVLLYGWPTLVWVLAGMPGTELVAQWLENRQREKLGVRSRQDGQ
jgi:hypothetical protein